MYDGLEKPGNWNEYRMMVINTLSRIESDIKELRGEISSIKIDTVKEATKHATWRSALVALVPTVIQLFAAVTGHKAL